MNKQASSEEYPPNNGRTAGVLGGLGAISAVTAANLGSLIASKKLSVHTDIDRDLEERVRKHVAPRYDGKVSINPWNTPQYHLTDKIVYSNHNLGSLAHELGHATDRTLQGKLTRPSIMIKKFPFMMGHSAPAALVVAAMGSHDGGKKDGKSSTAAKVGAGVLGASSGVVLGQEAYASAKGHIGLAKMLGSHKEAFRHTKTLIPSFGTYASMAAVPFLAYGLSKKIRKNLDKQASTSYYDQNNPDSQPSPWKAKAALATAGLVGGALLAHRASKIQINKDKFDEAIKHHDEAWDFIKSLNAKDAMDAPDVHEKAKYHYNRLQQHEQLFGGIKDAPYKGVMHSARVTSAGMGKFLLAKKFPNIHKL